MADFQPDEVDHQLLTLLQQNARRTAIELAEELGVSDNTVHNRMDRLEEAGVITGYSATVDHDRTGLELHFQFTCTVRISERSEVADEILTIPNVTEVTELMTGQRNLLVKVLGYTDENITEIAEQLDGLPLEINDENLIRTEHSKPLDYVTVTERRDGEE